MYGGFLIMENSSSQVEDLVIFLKRVLGSKHSQPPTLVLSLSWIGHAGWSFTSLGGSVHFSPHLPIRCLFSSLWSNSWTTVTLSWQLLPCVLSNPCKWFRMHLHDLFLIFHSSCTLPHCYVPSTCFQQLPSLNLKHWWSRKPKIAHTYLKAHIKCWAAPHFIQTSNRARLDPPSLKALGSRA